MSISRLKNMLDGYTQLGDKLLLINKPCPNTVDHTNKNGQSLYYKSNLRTCALCNLKRSSKVSNKEVGIVTHNKALHTMEEIEYQRELRRIENE